MSKTKLIRVEDAIRAIESLDENVVKSVGDMKVLAKIAVRRVEEVHIPEHNYENCHNATCRMKCRKEGYNMAIDDFLKRIHEKYTEEERKENFKQYCCNIKQELADIGQQLKAGGKDGRNQ